MTIISTGGTADSLRSWGIDVVPVDEVTGHPEILGGRVKTLHPKIHGGILGRAGHEGDAAQMRESGIEPIDLVVVNLYPFEEWVQRRGVGDDELIEQIDIGGPDPDPGGGQEPRARGGGDLAGPVRARSSTSSSPATARSRPPCAGGSPARPSSAPPATTPRSPTGSPRARASSPTTSSWASRSTSRSATARTRTSAAPTTPSAARARTCSRGWTTSTARRSRSTTSTTWMPRGACWPSSSCRRA